MAGLVNTKPSVENSSAPLNSPTVPALPSNVPFSSSWVLSIAKASVANSVTSNFAPIASPSAASYFTSKATRRTYVSPPATGSSTRLPSALATVPFISIRLGHLSLFSVILPFRSADCALRVKSLISTPPSACTNESTVNATSGPKNSRYLDRINAVTSPLRLALIRLSGLVLSPCSATTTCPARRGSPSVDKLISVWKFDKGPCPATVRSTDGSPGIFSVRAIIPRDSSFRFTSKSSRFWPRSRLAFMLNSPSLPSVRRACTSTFAISSLINAFALTVS